MFNDTRMGPRSATLHGALTSIGGAYSLLRRAWRRFFEIDGPQWAAAFAYYAFFSLFPAIVLFVTIASAFIEREQATSAIIAFIEAYIPLGRDNERDIFNSVAEVVEARNQAGAVASVVLIWGAIRFLSTLIRATNRAWGAEAHRWWRLPFKSLSILAIAGGIVSLALIAPTVLAIVKDIIFPGMTLGPWADAIAGFLLRVAVVFLALSLFYKVAPRRPTRFAQVWRGALCGAVLLQAAGGLFVIYVRDFATFNALYGTFGGVMALLLWVYVSGSIFIYCACLSSAQANANESAPV